MNGKPFWMIDIPNKKGGGGDKYENEIDKKH
jgi:hypothetical protein